MDLNAETSIGYCNNSSALVHGSRLVRREGGLNYRSFLVIFLSGIGSRWGKEGGERKIFINLVYTYIPAIEGIVIAR